MASLALQLKSHYNKPSQTLLKTTSSNFNFTHFFSSSSSSENNNNNNKNDDEKPSEKPYAFAGYFNDIKSKLKNQQEHQQQQQQPPNHSPGFRPSNLSPPNSPNSSSTSFDEIKKNLSEFRRRSSEFPSQQSQQHNVVQKGGNAGSFAHGRPANLSFDSIRDSLEQMKGRGAGKGNNSNNNNNTNDSMSLNMYKKSLKLQPAVGGGGKVIGGSVENLPMSIFGKEMKNGEGEGEGEVESLSVEFSRLYTYDQLGKKLRALRPEIKSGEEGSFSLSELNERVKKLKEIEKVEQMKDTVIGPAYRELRTSLKTLKDDKSKNKITPMQGISILSPSSIKASPKEHLVEKYFHPDNMSSEEKLKLKLEAVRDEFKIHESDCGSTRVQIAQLTTEILHLSSVLHKKDKHSRRGLQAKVQQRKKLLKYLRRTDWESYSFVLSKLGLRDNPDYKN